MTGELQEMEDKTVPCAAITEKRTNRLGGCVGVFFQLFDWNRRFAKKKLFSRKLLLPGKQDSKRFGGNEKLLKSKLNLIDDENRGSFPNRGEVVELTKHETRSPSLIARLMGLESMPSNHRDKGKKKKKPSNHRENEKCDLFDGEEEDNGFDKSRPQKMQRTTGVCDRRVVVKKFGSDALQIKNVLTRVRKHNQYNSHQQLASPVRSPKLHRRSSRLIDAATRILEPGKRNAKSAIAFPVSSRTRRWDNVGKEPVEVVVSPESMEFQCGYSNSIASCKACGSLVDVHGSSLVAEETGKNMACVSESSPFERSKRNVFWRNQEPSVSVSGKGRDNTDQVERKALHRARYDFNGKHGNDEMALPGDRNISDFHNQVLQREKFPPLAQSYILQSKRGCSSPANVVKCKEKDFIVRNRQSKAPAKFENSDLNVQRNFHTRVEDSSNRSGLSTPARKRRLACASGHGLGSSSMSPASRRLDGECSCECGNGPKGSNEDACSPLKLGSVHCCRESKERKEVQCTSNQMGERNPRIPFQKRVLLDASSLGLIQEKLKELASQEDEPIGGSSMINKSASLILHELLSSLALEQPYVRDINMSYAETACGRKGKTEMCTSIGNANSDYTSPGSVLEASFSNESCFSNSLDNISVPGHMRLPLEPIEPDWDVLEDSATSFKNSTSTGTYQAIANLVSHVSKLLRCLSNTGLILTHQRFTNAREVIIHTELLVGTTTQGNYLIGAELFDELMIYAARSGSLVNLPGLTGGFLVDAMIEHLEQRNISCGLKPTNTKADGLIRGVLEEVPKWAELARISMDEVVGIEMEKWFDLETHLFGVGSEIAYEILWCLVGELVMDLRKDPCR